MDKNTAPEKKKSFFNLFDIVIIGIALVIAALFLMWQYKDSAAPAADEEAPASKTVQYTIEITSMYDTTAELINVGDQLTDNVKRGDMGTIVSFTVENTVRSTKNIETGEFFMSEVPWLKTAKIVLEAECTETDSAITTQGGFQVRVGDAVSIKGPGYAGKGTLIDIDRGE